jgi:hypothetical protein
MLDIFSFAYNTYCKIWILFRKWGIKGRKQNVFKNIWRRIFTYRPSQIRALFRVKTKAASSPLQSKEGRKERASLCLFPVLSVRRFDLFSPSSFVKDKQVEQSVCCTFPLAHCAASWNPATLPWVKRVATVSYTGRQIFTPPPPSEVLSLSPFAYCTFSPTFRFPRVSITYTLTSDTVSLLLCLLIQSATAVC